MQEKKVLIGEDGVPFLEIKMNDYTTKRRQLTEGELEAFTSRQKERLSTAVAEAIEEGPSVVPPVLLAEDSGDTVTKGEAPVAKTKAGPPRGRRAPAGPAV